MRTLSGSMLKREKGSAQREPRPGTRLRTLWDLLQANRGAPVDIPPELYAHARPLRYLRDQYGLDIRIASKTRIAGKTGPHGTRCWILAGEWIEDEYRDYIAERLERTERK
jgi:hypothetical protein